MNILKRDKAAISPSTPGMEADRQLAQLIIEGDREAVSHLLDRHLSAVYGYLRRRTGPGQEGLVAQVVTATFDEALRKMRRFARGTESTPMRAWLFRTAARHLARQGHVDSAQGEESEALRDLRGAMRRLPARKQNVLALALFEGLTAEEIAPAAGLSQARSMRLLRSALRHVEKSLAHDSGEESLLG